MICFIYHKPFPSQGKGWIEFIILSMNLSWYHGFMIYDLNSLNKAQDFPVAYVLNNLKLPRNDT